MSRIIGTGPLTPRQFSSYIKIKYLKGKKTKKGCKKGRPVTYPVLLVYLKRVAEKQEHISTRMYLHNCTMQRANGSFLENDCFNQRLITCPVTIATRPARFDENEAPVLH